MKNRIEKNLIHETEGTEDAPKKQGLELSPQNTELQETLAILNDAVSHDKALTESNLANLRSAIEGMKITIGGKEVTLKDTESISSFNVFLNDLYKSWGIAETNLPTPNLSFVDPKELEYGKKSMNSDMEKFGTYTLNPETFALDFEKTKVFIPDLSAMEGERPHKVFQYVVDTYGDKYHIPGIEYWKWMIENPDKAEEVAKKQKYDIKDGNYYYFPGSSLCDSNDGWSVPCVGWGDGEFHRGVNWLGDRWSSNFRVLLLEK